jgi:hypothetical protein
MARSGEEWSGTARLGKAGQVRCGAVWSGKVRFGRWGVVWTGEDSRGRSWSGRTMKGGDYKWLKKM